MSEAPARRADDFAPAFEAAFVRLQVRIEEAYVSVPNWPQRVAAAIHAAFEFAAENPAPANTLTNEALAHGPDGMARYGRLVDYATSLLDFGRAQRPENAILPALTGRAVAGGLIMLIAQRLDQGRVAELPALASEAIQFALTPYLGTEEAKRVAELHSGE
jgi:hypothetical protein